MDGDLEISIDKLPIKRVEFIEENGAERFPPDVGHDEKKVELIRKIDFAWAVEREEDKQQEPASKKKKVSDAAKEKETSSTGANQPWQWQSLVENLQLAHQELSVIIDLINTVEANDAVTVASMTKPKQLPNEHLSDLAVSTATKLQCFQHLGKYLKQSSKALQKQVTREARFYGALIRLQQNWKVKRHRLVAGASANEGFYLDLVDNSLNDPAAVFRPSSLSTVRVERDSAGMLAVNLPPNSRRSLVFKFLGPHSFYNATNTSRSKEQAISEENVSDDASVRKTHKLIREVHLAIFSEQVFDLVNREAFNSSRNVNVTGIQENFLRLNIGQEASVSISLVQSSDGIQTGSNASTKNLETESLPMELSDEEEQKPKKSAHSIQTNFAIYLEHLFHEHVLVKAKNRAASFGRINVHVQPGKDNMNLLGHFNLSLAHRIFSAKVLTALETLVDGIPYVRLISHPSWHSRTSSWTICVEIPQSTLLAGSQTHISALTHMKTSKSQLSTKVLVIDDCISVEGEGAPNVIGLFKGKSETISPMNRYKCDLTDLPVILLQQIASQIIRWLHDEARSLGIKASRDFLSLSFELEQGEILSVVAHVDPEDAQGCVSWWLVMEDGFAEENKFQMDMTNSESATRKFLGYLPLDALHATLFDLVDLCAGGGAR
ncbi:OLC1v1037120C1 [Oldenlandia corymbosa var. corymbosa]|uniref:Mediator of RNA polymerase II transcription subunit 17 n=1 Tax=Oldenlandia corymbosa var. corymbosa TaxID=529605 RepID=A0AAV1CZL6_OLDCO|nr:OLC1v1037120C1 [Oldenlandia corymbosa var. corymbosa]